MIRTELCRWDRQLLRVRILAVEHLEQGGLELNTERLPESTWVPRPGYMYREIVLLTGCFSEFLSIELCGTSIQPSVF
jgi:hypothetical protein